jgi:hypothetical protein
MAETQNTNSRSGFIRGSDTESICTACSHSIKTERPADLEEAEEIHADVCLAKPDSHLHDIFL